MLNSYAKAAIAARDCDPVVRAANDAWHAAQMDYIVAPSGATRRALTDAHFAFKQAELRAGMRAAWCRLISLEGFLKLGLMAACLLVLWALN